MSISASNLVNIIPSVVSAGGSGLNFTGLLLDNATRVPINGVLSFPNAAAVGAYFGLSSKQYAFAQVYFLGFDNATVIPAALQFAQYPQSGAAAWLRGGAIPVVPALSSGTLALSVDGIAYTAAAVAFTQGQSAATAAAAVQAALYPTGGAAFTASISGTAMLTSSATGTIAINQMVFGQGVTLGTTISSGSGSTWVVAPTQTVSSESMIAVAATASFTGSVSGTALTVSSGTPALTIGMIVSGSGITVGSTIVSGAGAAWTLSASSTSTGSITIRAFNPPPVVSYDTISNGFTITSGIVGAPSSIVYPTGTVATTLNLTQALGAALSQGAAPATPVAFMTTLFATYKNWVTFTTIFNPDALNSTGNAQKQLFASWANTSNPNRIYVAWDNDITAAESNTTTSLGDILDNIGSNGTVPIYDTGDNHYAAFFMGSLASINFNAKEGRTTMAYRTQAGLVPCVVDDLTYANLLANGYNFYGVYASAANQWNRFQPGSITGSWNWVDSYVNQIWMNDAFQVTLINLLSGITSDPYNVDGYNLIQQALMGPINAALNFGAIRSGVTPSPLEAAIVNNAAGKKIDGVLATRGWYLQIVPATAAIRAARKSPIINFWYMDGGSIQTINMNSIEVQ